MKRTETLTARMVVGAFAQAFALFAMLVQFAFYADHLGANAVAGVGAAGPGERLGVLSICTGDGIQRVNPDGSVDGGAAACPICESASILAFGEPVAFDLPVFDFVPVETLRLSLAAISRAEARFPGEKPIRAPPVWARA